MNALKESIIEKLDALPDRSLGEVVDFVNFLVWRGTGDEASILDLAGGLSGEPISSDMLIPLTPPSPTSFFRRARVA